MTPTGARSPTPIHRTPTHRTPPRESRALPTRRTPHRAVSILLLALASTGGACGDGPTGLTVSDVVITSPIGDVMAVGRSVDLHVAAEAASGEAVSGRTFEWRSSDPGVATVTGTGVVQGVAAGSTTLSATSDGVTGSLSMRVVNADLATVGVLLDDAYTRRLVAHLSTGPGAGAETALDHCQAALEEGNVLALEDCLGSIAAVDRSDATDRALLAVLDVIARRASLLLNL